MAGERIMKCAEKIQPHIAGIEALHACLGKNYGGAAE